MIVDSGSTDETLAIAGRFPNVRTVHRPFDTHAQQWRFAVEETGITSDWLLRLDADYLVEPALRDELAALAPAPATAAYEIAFIYCIDGRPLRASLYPALPVLFRRGRGASSRMAIPRSCASTAPSSGSKTACCTMIARASSAGCSRNRATRPQEAEKLATRPWSELSWPDRLRRTRVLGPLAVAVHCLFVKGLIFDGTAGLLYTAQRVTADLILSMHLLRRDLDRLMPAKAP